MYTYLSLSLSIYIYIYKNTHIIYTSGPSRREIRTITDNRDPTVRAEPYSFAASASPHVTIGLDAPDIGLDAPDTSIVLSDPPSPPPPPSLPAPPPPPPPAAAASPRSCARQAARARARAACLASCPLWCALVCRSLLRVPACLPRVPAVAASSCPPRVRTLQPDGPLRVPAMAASSSAAGPACGRQPCV